MEKAIHTHQMGGGDRLGSKNAKKVTMFGGWLPPNAYKVLHVMALVSFDDPVPKKKIDEALVRGAQPPAPYEYYARLGTTYEVAFARRFPELPEVDRHQWGEEEHAQAKRHASAKKTVDNAIKELLDLSIIEQTRSALRGRQTARFRLHLDRLPDALIGRESSIQTEGNLPQIGRKSSTKPPFNGRKPSSQVEEKLTPDVQRDFQPLDDQTANDQSSTDKALPPKVSTGTKRYARERNALDAPPDEIEAERRRQMLALEAVMADQRKVSA